MTDPVPPADDLDRNASAPAADADSASEPDEDRLSEEMTPAELAEAKAYGRIELVCDLADRLLDVAYLAVAAFVLARPIDAWLTSAWPGSSDTVRLVLLFLIVIGLHLVVSAPLSFYSGYLLEHRFGMSHLSLRGWLVRYAKRNGLAMAFGLVMFVALYWIIWTTGGWWWVVAAAAFFAVSVVLGQLTPVLILPLFYKIERLEESELSSHLARLAEPAGLSIEGIYRMDLSAETAKANAMLAGLGRTRRVLLGDTVIEKFTTDEITVIFGHEIGHHVHRHIRKMILAGAVFSAAGFWLCDRVLLAASGVGADYADMPVWTLPLLMFLVTLFSMILEPIQNTISRHYERQCDRYALESTGLKDAYISAFRKLAKLNKDDPDPHPIEVALLHSHPPISKRLAMAERS